METILTLELIEDFRSSLIARGRSVETHRAYCQDLREFLIMMAPVTTETFDLKAVTWLNANRTTWAPKTVGRRMTALRTFARLMKWPVEVLTEYNAPDPGRAVPHPIPEGIPGVLAMVDAAKNDRQRALIGLCGLCGLRLAEALSTTAKSFQWAEQTLTVVGKGDKTRVIPLGSKAKEIVTPAFLEAAVEFDGGRLVRYADRFARQIITDCGSRAGLRRSVSSHDLRATFATAAYDKTLNIRAVQELLGHSSAKTTEGYTGIAMDTMRDAADLA